MLIIASSGKGGTGRTVTSCNIAYRLAELGKDVAYVDFDFGSPTAGTVFELPGLERGADGGGIHDYFRGKTTAPTRVDVFATTKRGAVRNQARGFGKLVLIPGDRDGGDFSAQATARLATRLLAELDNEFDACLVDLRSGRSNAVDLVLRTLRPGSSREWTPLVRWLVFHRLTPQHLQAASSLIYDPRGILHNAEAAGQDRAAFGGLIRTVRTAMLDLNTLKGVDSGPKAIWLQKRHNSLTKLARDLHLGESRLLGSTPFEHMLQLREQLVLDSDVRQQLADAETAQAFVDLAGALCDDERWAAC